MERKLILLGILRQHDMYGYQINELIDAHLGSSINLTKPTAYRLLHDMADQGWISYREEKVGKRPTRRIFALTESGEAAFQKLLKNSLSQYQPADGTSTIPLAFLDTLPPEEALPLLQVRRGNIEVIISSMKLDQSHHGAFRLIIEHQIRHLETDLEWLSEVVADLESSERGQEDEVKIHPLSPE